MSAKYSPGGGLNPWWVKEQCDARELEEELQYEYASAQMAEIASNEAKMEFLRRYKDNPEEYKLAKQILGIHD